MRPLLLTALCALALASIADAGRQRCGDDVDGRPVPCDCGDILVASRTLGDDDPITTRACRGTGLLVQVPSTHTATLALGGHTLTGSGRGFGIQVVGGGAGGLTIAGPGAVRGFGVGILAPTGQLALLSGVTAADNASDGIRVVGEGYTVTRCEAARNGRDGFALGGRAQRILGNRALENGRYGFAVAGRDAAIGDTDGNEAAGNWRDGLRVRGRGHDLTGAVATANGGRGISARITEGRIAGTRAADNRGRDVRAVGADLTVSDTDARGNGGGIDVRGARVRDGGGNRAADCRVGGRCR